jgi:hypothetical protein
MRAAVRAILGLLLFVMLPDSASLFAQEYSRERFPIPVPEILANIYSNLDRGAYDTISKTLIILSPLLQDLEQKEGVDIRGRITEAIQSKNRERVARELERMVIIDISDLLNFVNASRPLNETDKIHIRIALLEYNVIGPQIQETDFSMDQRVKNSFKKMMILLSEDNPGSVKDLAKNILKGLRPVAQLKGPPPSRQ